MLGTGAASMLGGLARNLRFLLSLVPAALLLFGWIAVIGAASERMPGGWGLAISIVGGSSLALGLLLAYWVSVDWLNLRLIRRALVDGDAALRDGEVVAVEGVVRITGEPMRAPFSETSCAAYTYVLSGSQHSTRRDRSVRNVMAQGFHMIPTKIEGETGSFGVHSLPGFEDDLRENVWGRRWVDEARELTGRLYGNAPSAGERERQSRLLQARHDRVGEVHQDYCMGTVTAAETGDGLVVDEEVLPVGQRVCVIGTYDASSKGLTARRARLGPNLFVYRGRAEEVLSRVGKETRGFTRAVAFLTGLGVVLLAIPFLFGAS